MPKIDFDTLVRPALVKLNGYRDTVTSISTKLQILQKEIDYLKEHISVSPGGSEYLILHKKWMKEYINKIEN